MTFPNPLARVNMIGWSAMALTVALGGYTLSLRVAAERTAVEELRTRIAGQADAIRSAHAELRVRMRMPQLERWNTESLALQPVAARQFVGDTGALVRLVAHGDVIVKTPAIIHAIAPVTAPPPMLRTVSYPQPPALLDSDPDLPPAPKPEPVKMAKMPAAKPARAATVASLSGLIDSAARAERKRGHAPG